MYSMSSPERGFLTLLRPRRDLHRDLSLRNGRDERHLQPMPPGLLDLHIPLDWILYCVSLSPPGPPRWPLPGLLPPLIILRQDIQDV